MQIDSRTPAHLESPDLRCTELAARQHGLLSRAQALECGLSAGAIARRVATHRWQRQCPSVFRIAGTPPSWRQDLMALCLWAGKDSVVSHLAAARLWRLDGIPKSPELEVTVPRGRQLRSRAVLDTGARPHRSTDLTPHDRKVEHGVPVTDVTRTLIDLAAILEEEKLERACVDAFRRKLSSPNRIRGRLRKMSRRGRSGLRSLARVLDKLAPAHVEAHSPLESRVIQALRKARLPAPVPQYIVTDEDRWFGQVDFAYPDRKIAIEAEGRRYHDSPEGWDRDLLRSSDLASIGWVLLRVSWNTLENDERRFVAQVRRALDLTKRRRVRRSSSRRDGEAASTHLLATG